MVLFSAVFELNSTIFLELRLFFAHTYKYIVTAKKYFKG